MHQYDNRYLWMNLKRIISSHFANYRESWEANRLIAKGMIHPTLSKTYRLEDTGQAALDVHHNRHQGKVGDDAAWLEVAIKDGAKYLKTEHDFDAPDTLLVTPDTRPCTEDAASSAVPITLSLMPTAVPLTLSVCRRAMLRGVTASPRAILTASSPW